jgi:hypothetical protein
MKITEINYTTTPETVIERDATPEEMAQWEADKASDAQRAEEMIKKAEAKAAIADRLGLTPDELALLLA